MNTRAAAANFYAMIVADKNLRAAKTALAASKAAYDASLDSGESDAVRMVKFNAFRNIEDSIKSLESKMSDSAKENGETMHLLTSDEMKSLVAFVYA